MEYLLTFLGVGTAAAAVLHVIQFAASRLGLIGGRTAFRYPRSYFMVMILVGAIGGCVFGVLEEEGVGMVLIISAGGAVGGGFFFFGSLPAAVLLELGFARFLPRRCPYCLGSLVEGGNTPWASSNAFACTHCGRELFFRWSLFQKV